ncbi:prolyl aminopeptidase [Novosphingobium sp. ZN18A2]|uniref:prolyl aminopeptidase n=1 Tax=Novosphingobium sp. ZN18A2 TaxID=3079861 RepID=UPI0030D5BC78
MTPRRTLYPPIEPFESGMLDVGDGHSIYWERCGTRGGKPVVFLHGGPGAGCSADQRRQFDPALYDILLFDQRGCGRSTPFASLDHNTTWDLVADMERLRAMCGHEKWQVFGGSWGSTLALAYAETHPERVSELVLRGIFLGTEREYDWLYRYGASALYPEGWEEFAGHVPEDERGDLVEAYRRRLTSDDEATRTAAAKAWSRWEALVVTLLPDPAIVEHSTDDEHAVAIARIENHFFHNMCWFEPGQLLANAGRLKGIPGVIVQGRHDCCTPPESAWALKKAWPDVDLQIVPDAGHLFSEPGITDGLIRASDRFAGKEGI